MLIVSLSTRYDHQRYSAVTLKDHNFSFCRASFFLASSTASSSLPRFLLSIFFFLFHVPITFPVS